MAHLLPKLAYRRAMIFDISSFSRTGSTAAAVLWTMSLGRDPEVLTSFRLGEAGLFEQSRQHFDKMPRYQQISIPHGSGLAHLFVFMDGSAILSREVTAGMHDVLPLPLRINRSPNVTILSGGQPWFCPEIKIWAKGNDAAVMALHDRPDDCKTDAREFLDFSAGADTRTQDPRFQPVIDALFEDIGRAADIAAGITDPFLSSCPPGTVLPDGTVNRWSKSLPYSALSAEEIEDIQRRAYLAGVLIREHHGDEKLRAFTPRTVQPEHRANNIVQMNGSLTYCLAPFGVTEEDFLGYDRERLGGYTFATKQRRKKRYLPQNPEVAYELNVRFSIDEPPSAHEIIEARAALAAAEARKAARLAGEMILA